MERIFVSIFLLHFVLQLTCGVQAKSAEEERALNSLFDEYLQYEPFGKDSSSWNFNDFDTVPGGLRERRGPITPRIGRTQYFSPRVGRAVFSPRVGRSTIISPRVGRSPIFSPRVGRAIITPRVGRSAEAKPHHNQHYQDRAQNIQYEEEGSPNLRHSRSVAFMPRVG